MKTTLDVIAVVPVRAGSKGLPGKNIRTLGGKPLYLHAVLQGLRFADKCIITTDIPEILSSSPPDGALILARSAELSADLTTMSEVINDIILKLKLTNETILLLQATSPLRTDADVESTLDLYAKNTYEMVMTVAQTGSEVLKHGIITGQKYLPISNPKYCFENRQNLPKVFCHNGAVYVFNANTFVTHGSLPYENIGTVVMPKISSLDIDTLAQFEVAEKYFLAKD